jgi:hypothetical protein
MDVTVSTIHSGDLAFGGGLLSLGWIAWIVVILVGLVVWVGLARSSLVQGGQMERSDRVPQLYGYSVCLIALVVMLVNVSTIIDRVFTLSDPLSGGDRFGWGGGAVLSSFEAYKATMDRGVYRPPGADAAPAEPKPTDAELRARFEALRADQIARSRNDARRDLTSGVLMILVAGALFLWHWRWLRRAATPPATT